MPPLKTVLSSLTLAVSLGSAQPAPVLDRDLFFGEIEIGGAQISPDGQFISFLRPNKGVRNIWLKKAGEPFSAARPLTAEAKRPITSYFWTRDSRFLLYSMDKDGDENFNIYAVSPTAAAGEKTGVPPLRDMTGLKGVRVQIYDLPKSKPGILYLGLNDRDKAWHDLYELDIATGAKSLLRKNTDRIAGWVFDNKAQLRLAVRSADDGSTEIMRVDPDKFAKIYSCGVLETCGPVRFDKANKLVYFVDNKGAKDLMDLNLMDPATGQLTPVESDPLKRVDFGGAVFSDLTDELVATTYEDDRVRIVWKNRQREADYQWLQSKLPNAEIRHGSHTTDENLWLVSAFSDTEPGATYLFDRKNRKLELQYKVRERIPREHLAKMEPVRYESSDGLEIPAYLTLPKGVPAKNLPVVVVPHGGPWGRDSWGYSGMAQFLANRGYAVLQPNFRASTGFGKKFLDKGNGEWGRKMQDDLTWGVKWLTQKGIADPKRVGIMGGSYGGYATLAGVAFTPEVYAAGVSIVGPSNLFTLLDSIPAYWEAGRKILYARMADPGTEEGKKRLREMSPLFAADKIKTPLMVQQGANDPRVNQAESDQIVIALRDRGFPVEYLVAPDEGHGFLRPVNMLAGMAAAEQFFAKHLGGRAQQGGTAEVVARLKEITVDPKTVALAKKVDASAGAPKPAAPILTGLFTYKTAIAVGGQNIPVQLSTEIKQENGKIVAVDTMKMPMGEAKDTAILDPATLNVLNRAMTQGGGGMTIEFKDGKATGSMKMGGAERPINADLGGPVFADAAGAQQAIAALPLAEGYSAVYRNFDLQKAKLKLMQLKVAGSEAVTVPAGAFDCWKVEVTPTEGGADKMTLWVSKSDRKAVKMVSVMSQMGGATVTSELTK
jgi:dipeptidyl aminopeptidase/acylaminoacyl peptidase